MENDLDIRLRRRLTPLRGTWPVIAARARVSYSWICKFAVGRIENPGYDTLKRLAAALDESPPLPTSASEPAKAA